MLLGWLEFGQDFLHQGKNDVLLLWSSKTFCVTELASVFLFLRMYQLVYLAGSKDSAISWIGLYIFGKCFELNLHLNSLDCFILNPLWQMYSSAKVLVRCEKML